MAKHGFVEQRGIDTPAKARNAEGRFGFMFKDLDPFLPDISLLISLAQNMQQPSANPPTQFDNPGIPAGFTFFGQFVDHDITLDNTSTLEEQADPEGMKNFRTPIFDLDSVYADGPEKNPDLYDGPKLRLASHDGIDDLLRDASGKANIIEGRNDENAVICQLQIGFIKFHNQMVEQVPKNGKTPEQIFKEAQRLGQFHYQWVVLTDFLPRIVGQDVVDSVLKKPAGNSPIRADLKFYKPKKTPFMPLEFSVAGYRFGHSQIRPGYRLRPGKGAAIFGPQSDATNLNGFRSLLPDLKIEWENFFDVPGSSVTPQRSLLIDTKLSGPLFQLPFGNEPFSLAERNLRRGKVLNLPSGQAVAQEMKKKLSDVPVLSNEELGMPNEAGWNGQAPLWFYILKESELQHGGRRLGAVGGRIVAETLVGLLAHNTESFFQADPKFQPKPPIAESVGKFEMGDLLKFARAA